MERWVVIYEHRFGVDVLFIDAPGGEYVEEKDVLATFPEIEFELDREDEWIQIYAINDNDVSTLVKAND